MEELSPTQSFHKPAFQERQQSSSWGRSSLDHRAKRGQEDLEHCKVSIFLPFFLLSEENLISKHLFYISEEATDATIHPNNFERLE